MFGDLLLSGPASATPLHIPTIGDTRQVFPADAVFAPVGLAQKIAIIRDDFAVAWSGTQIVARTVIRELTEQFSQRAPTSAQLRDYLEQLPGDFADQLTLLAMVEEAPGRMHHLGFQAEHEDDPRFGVFRAGGSGIDAVRGFCAACSHSPKTKAEL